MRLLFACFWIVVPHVRKARAVLASGNQCGPEKKSEFGIALLGSTFKSVPSVDLLACLQQCDQDEKCYSANFWLIERVCDLNHRTRSMHGGRVIPMSMSIYMGSTVREKAVYKPVGCYRHVHRVVDMTLLRNYKQEWQGYFWSKLDDLVNACAQRVMETSPGMTVFGIEDDSECWAGINPAQTYQRMAVSYKCWPNGLGKGFNIYVYEFN